MQITQPQTAFGFSGPLYAQVAALLRSRISKSFWTPAAPLPNEAALAKEIGVSIGTVRKALEILEDERLIRRRQGRGTFVVDSSEQDDVARFSSLIIEGRRLYLEVTEFRATVGPMPPHVGPSLQALPSAPAIIIDMTWRAEQTVRGAERIVVVEAHFPGLESVPQPAAPTLFQVYRSHYHVVVNRVVERVRAGAADGGAQYEATLG